MKNLSLLSLILLCALGLFACDKGKAGAADVSQTTSAPSKGAGMNLFQPVVAGRFYTDNADKLRNQVDGFIDAAAPPDLGGDVMGIVAPHAGYVFSGPVAGFAYKTVAGKKYDLVVVLGLSHQVPGTVSVLDYDGYNTPLGALEIDGEISRRIIGSAGWIDANPMLFSHEHSLEVQLPFIHQALPGTKIVMISMRSGGLGRCKALAKILDDALAGKRALVVASSDMSHFHPYDTANKMDLATLDLLKKLDTDDLAKRFESRESEMCGSGPVMTLMELYKLRGGDAGGVKVLRYQNSGDTAGGKDEVVGYGAVAFVGKVDSASDKKAGGGAGEDYLTAEDKAQLLGIARKTVETYITEGKEPEFEIKSENLLKDGAAFVTLHKNGQLRGCIGQIIARIPLWKCVREMAVAAATQDPRFSKVTAGEITQLHIEISVLTPPKECKDPQTVEVGRHGLIMSRGYQRGLLLPQVPTEWGWDRETFLEQTCRKAGMDLDCWKDPKAKIETFEAIVFSE